MKIRIISSVFWVVLWLFVAYLVLQGRELPYQSTDKYVQANYDEIGLRSSVRKTDYGRGQLTAGSLFVELNVNYLYVDSFCAFVQPVWTTAIDANDSLCYFVVRKVAGDSLGIYAIWINGMRSYTDTSDVEWFTFLKDR